MDSLDGGQDLLQSIKENLGQGVVDTQESRIESFAATALSKLGAIGVPELTPLASLTKAEMDMLESTADVNDTKSLGSADRHGTENEEGTAEELDGEEPDNDADELPQYAFISEASKTWKPPIYYPAWTPPSSGAMIYTGLLTPSKEKLADVLTPDDDATEEQITQSQAEQSQSTPNSQGKGLISSILLLACFTLLANKFQRSFQVVLQPLEFGLKTSLPQQSQAKM